MNIPYLDLTLSHKAQEQKINGRIQEVINSAQFILGKVTEECEQKLAQYTGAPFCLTVASGTDALIMALMAIDLQPGDEVIMTSFSFFATAEAVVLLGGKPVFVDIEPDTYNIDVRQIPSLITPNTKAIIPVGLYGQVADMDELNRIAKKHNISLIEDAAQSFGATYHGHRSCNLSRFGCTSFFPAKPLGCYGDGGAIFCQTKEDYDALVQIRAHGQSARYYHTRMGINGRLDAIQCAVIDAKLERYPWEVKKRQEIANSYTQAFKELNHVAVPVVRPGRESVWAQYTVAVDKREEWIRALNELGVPTSIHYPKGMHQQPALARFKPTRSLPVCESKCEQVFSIPLYPDMPQDHVDYVIEAFGKVSASL